MESFTIYDDAQVGIELLSGQVTITLPGEITTCERAFSDLATHAVHRDDARALIQRAAQNTGESPRFPARTLNGLQSDP